MCLCCMNVGPLEATECLAETVVSCDALLHLLYPDYHHIVCRQCAQLLSGSQITRPTGVTPSSPPH